MSYLVSLRHKFDEPVDVQLARVPVRGDFVERPDGPWEVKRVLLHRVGSPCAATVWGEPVDFPLPPAAPRRSDEPE